MMVEKQLAGQCLCGFIRYEVEGPFSHETHCGCSICRRASGAPVVPWATVQRSSFRFKAGTPASYESSKGACRTFCPRCGTPLTFTKSEYPDELDFTICSLLEPDALRPKDVTFERSLPKWFAELPHLPTFAGQRSD